MSDIKERYLAARRRIIENDFSRMNDMQRRAVFTTEGALLILAGAGSGKTTVLINRTANLIKYGGAYFSESSAPSVSQSDVEFLERYAEGAERGEEAERRMIGLTAVNPPKSWQIMAITFTNKAAAELKQRLGDMLGNQGDEVWASTFHATCARMLRRNADRLGYSSRFAIYDTDDQKRVIKAAMTELNLDDKTVPSKMIINEISRAKDSMMSPVEFAQKAGSDFRLKKAAEVYAIYQRKLKEADAMDFDDLLYNTVVMLEQNEDLLEYYRNRFRYIMVDEYQDTNHAQYRLIKLLSGENGNICVVGDDDQSIYKFRGATIENILNFEKTYPNAQVIRLEQNYRSTQTILDAANSVIGNNSARKGKRLWTSNGQGEKIVIYTADGEREEAEFVAKTILDSVAAGGRYCDHAVLYRMNAQSNTIENQLMRAGIPYRVMAGHRFYDRKEIRDMLAYLSVISNTSDEVRLGRIINEPKRGIGDRSVQTASEIASGLGISMFEVLREADRYPSLSRSASKMMQFAQMIDSLAEIASDPDETLEHLLTETVQRSGYREALINLDEKAQDRLENIAELGSTLQRYEDDNGDEASLGGFLEEIALISDIDNYDETSDSVVLMTLHSAKGLEFPIVFLPGMEEGIFPGMQTMLNPDEVEEERRLAYVGITRAKRKLYIIHARSRMIFGTTNYNKLSRFAQEIDPQLIERKAPARRTVQPGRQAPRPAMQAAATQGITGIPTQAKASFAPGERVRHRVFGEGEVISVRPSGGDALLEIKFAKVGMKKLMANFAGLKKITD